MLMVSLNYENSCCEEEYKPIQDALLAGEDWGVINCELFDDVLVIEEATVDLAIKMGWDIQKFVHEHLIEMVQDYVELDGEITASARRLLMNHALYYIYDCLDIPYEPIDD